MQSTHNNYDPSELEQFAQLADQWWHPTGKCKPLHDINPLRLAYIQARAKLKDSRVLDIGCGGGILTEALARAGAQVLGIDASDVMVRTATQHAAQSDLPVTYRQITAEALADEQPAAFDVVLCMELLEHVPEPKSLVAACAHLLAPDGQLFFSTINRTFRSRVLAIGMAEYVLGMLPRGTHRHDQFIKPSELHRYARAQGLRVADISGMGYNPLQDRYYLSADVSVNYLMHCTASTTHAP